MARSGEDEDTEARDAEPAAAQAATGSGRGPVLRAGALRLLRTHPRGRGGGGAGRRITPDRRVASGPAPRFRDTGCQPWGVRLGTRSVGINHVL